MTMHESTAISALHTLTPRFHSSVSLGFTGGEPLLAFPVIQAAVHAARAISDSHEVRFTFHLTTHGMHLRPQTLRFLVQNKFLITLSHDGLAHAAQRGEHSRLQAERAISLALEMDVPLEINAVFTPKHVHRMAESVDHMITLGVTHITAGPDIGQPWDSLALETLAQQIRRIRNQWPRPRAANHAGPRIVLGDDPNPSLFSCNAGQNRLAIGPDGRIWPCHLFHDWQWDIPASPYCLGQVPPTTTGENHLAKINFPVRLHLSSGRSQSPTQLCCTCEHLVFCRICPVHAAMSTGQVDRVPTWLCQLNQMQHRVACETDVSDRKGGT